MGQNSVGLGSRLWTCGSTSVTANEFRISVTAAPPNVYGKFFYGPAQSQVPFGNGWLCVSPGGLGLFRLYPPEQTSTYGALDRLLDFTQPPAGSGPGEVLPGSTWYFQFWYRDPAAGGANFNLSNARAASFVP